MKKYPNINSSFAVILLLLLASFSGFSQLVKWERVFGGPSYEYGRFVIQCQDKGYLVAGSTSSYTANTDAYLLKVDSNGTFKWHKIFGGGNVEWAMSVKEILSDSGFIFCGYTNSIGNGGYDVYLVRTDKLGNVIWEKTYGGSNWDFGNSVSITSDGGFIICGSTYSYGNGNEDVYVIKTDASGVLQWDTTYGGFDDEQANEIQQTADGGYIIAAQTKSYGAGNYDAWVIKLNAQGDTLWTHVEGGAGDDLYNSVTETMALNYLTGGYITTVNGDQDSYFSLYDNAGVTQFNRDFPIPNNQNIKSIRECYNGNIFTLGSTNNGGGGGYDANYLLLSSGGWYINGGTRGGANNEYGYHGEQAKDSGFIFLADTRTWGNGLTDLFLVKLDKYLQFTLMPIVGQNDTQEISANSFSFYPNPANDYIIVHTENRNNEELISIVDLFGRKVYESQVQNNSSSQMRIDISLFPDGLYFINSSSGIKGQKLIVRH